MLRFDQISSTPPGYPFRNVAVGKVRLGPETRSRDCRDFPQIDKTGFNARRDFPMGPSFKTLLAEVRN